MTGSRQAPTAATTSAISSLVRQGAYNVNGLRSMFNNYLLDGMDNNAYGESNQGFDNQIIAAPARLDRPVPGGDQQRERGVRPLCRRHDQRGYRASGTNRFHTTLYEFLRNTDLNAFGYIKPLG